MKLSLCLPLSSLVLLIASGCAAPGPSDEELTEEANQGSGGTGAPSGAGSTSTGAVAGDGDTVTPPVGAGASPGDGDGEPIPTPSGCALVDPNDLLSDFESGEAKLSEVGGRAGSWYMSDDGSGTTTPEKIVNTPLAATAAGACSSASAFQTTGSGFSGWGALIAVDLVPKVGETKQPYDASAYSGVSFRAKASGNLQVRVELATTDSMPEGGVCDPEAGTGAPARCGDHFGMNVVLSGEWKDVVVPFSSLTQKGWGLAAAGFDASGVYSFRIKVEGGSYDYTIDDVQLIK